MSVRHPIAIIGGGPAGALAGAQLAAAGEKVILFEEKVAWEKPCGGGITHKALQQYPFLAEAGRERNLVAQCELISPAGRRLRLQMQHPVAIFSRVALNGFLLQRARLAGVDVRHERVTQIAGAAGDWSLLSASGAVRASLLLLAAGARNPFRSQFLSPISPGDLMLTAGYFIPRRNSPMQIQFLQGITGYIWVFPRADHVSAGIAGKMGETSAAALRRILERWLEANGFLLAGARFYSHILPSFRASTFEKLEVSGAGWALLGDSAGLVDPITGEGLYYALRSAELCANAWLAGRPGDYLAQLRGEILPELTLAARIAHHFYNGQILGESVLERMISLTAQNDSLRQLMSDLFAGIQGYRDLRSRLHQIVPAAIKAELKNRLSGSFRQPWRAPC